VPQKDQYFATTKSTNYLVNALALLDAQVESYDQVYSPLRLNARFGASMDLQHGALTVCEITAELRVSVTCSCVGS
jgi:hypothetical protein